MLPLPVGTYLAVEGRVNIQEIRRIYSKHFFILYTRGRGEVLGQAGVAKACACTSTLTRVSKNQSKIATNLSNSTTPCMSQYFPPTGVQSFVLICKFFLFYFCFEGLPGPHLDTSCHSQKILFCTSSTFGQPRPSDSA